MDIQHNLNLIHQKIETACEEAKRNQNTVKLLAVSKTKPISAILSAYQAGQTAFGENYVQEGVEKIQYFESQGINLEWHFIGPLQSNKTRLVAEHFDWMQTLDRAKIAERLNEQRPTNKAPLNVLIQVNISDEESKSGIQPEEMPTLAKHIENLPHLHLRGLMAIPAPTDKMPFKVNTLRFKILDLFYTFLHIIFPKGYLSSLISRKYSGDRFGLRYGK